MKRVILAIVAVFFTQTAWAGDCTSISSPCSEYKQFVTSLDSTDLAAEVAKKFASAVGQCATRWPLAGAKAIWSGLNSSYDPRNAETVKPCLESIGHYIHSTNYLFHGTFDMSAR